MIPLFVGSWLQILAYNVTGYASAKEWYWLLQPILLVLVGAVLLRVLTDLLIRPWPFARHLLVGGGRLVRRQRRVRLLARCLLSSIPTARTRRHPYSPVIPFLEANTEPGALIGMTGGGNVGYLMPSRTIVNMDGLINSYAYFQAMQAGTGADYLYDTGLRYVFANPTLLAGQSIPRPVLGRLEVWSWSGAARICLRLLPGTARLNARGARDEPAQAMPLPARITLALGWC